MSLLDKRAEPCRVCGETETSGFHLNTVTCEACKKFYLRNIKNHEYERFNCARSGNCVITKQTRTTCAFCRFQKCLSVGMSQTERKQETVSFKELPCAVCDMSASGLHFGVISCEGCKGFFRRHVSDGVNFTCSADGRCEINQITRNNCKACRLSKCKQVGMDLKSCKIGRQSNLFKQQLKSTIDNKSLENLNCGYESQHLNSEIIQNNSELNYNNNISLIQLDNTDLVIQQSFNEESRELVKKINDSYVLYTSYKTAWMNNPNILMPYQLLDVDVCFEFLNAQITKCKNYLANLPFIQQFQMDDPNKLLYNSAIPLAVLELTKLPNYTNIFDCEKEKFEKILKHFPYFSSDKFNSFIKSLIESVKELKLDGIEYALYSITLILSNAANVQNTELLQKLNIDIAKSLIEYMQLRRNEYESSTKLIQLSGKFEKVNILFQHEIYKKCMTLRSFGLNIEKFYCDLIYYNRWFQPD